MQWLTQLALQMNYVLNKTTPIMKQDQRELWKPNWEKWKLDFPMQRNLLTEVKAAMTKLEMRVRELEVELG